MLRNWSGVQEILAAAPKPRTSNSSSQGPNCEPLNLNNSQIQNRQMLAGLQAARPRTSDFAALKCGHISRILGFHGSELRVRLPKLIQCARRNLDANVPASDKWAPNHGRVKARTQQETKFKPFPTNPEVLQPRHEGRTAQDPDFDLKSQRTSRHPSSQQPLRNLLQRRHTHDLLYLSGVQVSAERSRVLHHWHGCPGWRFRTWDNPLDMTL